MQKIDIKTIVKVLESSKHDIDIWDILSEFDEETEEEILDFIEENREEFEIFLNTTLYHVMNRLKIRMSFASNKED
ncbi:hypothetical protein [Mammaliicoccus sciuri]|uniref:hypothetical protein n=1 Tax=Mammaliicoccus sciuri TaxID=1296 RepID=UPI0021CE9B96|nr:hypothetical protein [Mammaliicoccus sciuri]UXV31239.1 hypothetical protein MUA60_09690 [Mammaliicoccus sciuri]